MFRSSALAEKNFGSDHPNVADALSIIGDQFESKKQYDKARDAYGQSLAIREKTAGPNHPYTAGPLQGLCTVDREQKKYDQALKECQRGLAIREKVFGTERPQVASSLVSLGKVWAEKGDAKEATAAIDRAMAICKKVKCGEGALANQRFERAKLYWKAGERPRSLALANQARDGYAKLKQFEEVDEVNQ